MEPNYGPWTDPATGIRILVKPSPSGIPGAWLGYVEVPAELTYEEVNAFSTRDMVGGFDDFIGFDTWHPGDMPDLGGTAKDEAWVRGECLRIAALMAPLRDERMEAVRAADLAIPWPRWKFEAGNEMAFLICRGKDTYPVARIVRALKPRGDKITWNHWPKKLGDNRADSVGEAVAALAERGVLPPSKALIGQLASWTVPVYAERW